MKNIVGKVITLKDGLKGKCVCKLESGEYLLGTGKGCHITTGFYEKEILQVEPAKALADLVEG